MRNLSLGALVIFVCAVLAVTATAGHACASFWDLLPDNLFGNSKVQALPESDTGHNFFAAAMGMIPVSDQSTKYQMSGLLGMKLNLDSTSIPLPETNSGSSWMSGLMTFGGPADISNSTAMSSYDRMIKRFENQSNIFVY